MAAVGAGESAVDSAAVVRSAGTGRTRTLLRWFGIDATDLDPTTPCAVCGLPAAVGSDRCPSHAESAIPTAPIPGVRMGGVVAVALTLALLGLVLGAVSADDRFAWIGAVAAAAQVVGGVARQLRLERLATWMGMAAFFTALILIFAGVLVACIAALPLLLERLLA